MMEVLDLKKMQHELRKRLAYPYRWGRIQNDSADQQTAFIYHTTQFDQLQHQAASLPQSLQNYAYNRWLNFWSAKAVEQIFGNHPAVTPHRNPYHKTIDFYLQKIPFDHKTTIFPKGYEKNLEYAQNNQSELLHWLYENQSQQSRKYLQNRIFIVLYNTQRPSEHWKLKAEILLIQQKIIEYLSTFDLRHMVKLSGRSTGVYADIIWIIR